MIVPVRAAGLALVAAAASLAGAAEIRPDHPRIFITRETVPELRKRCETTHRDFFARVKAHCDRGEGGAIQHALCHLLTGQRRYSDEAKASVRKDPEQRPGQESIALDWIYDTLTKQKVAEFGAMLLGKSRRSIRDPGNPNFRELVWWNQHYAYSFSETFMKDLFHLSEFQRNAKEHIERLKETGRRCSP